MDNYTYETLVFDRGSVREKDKNGFLHVKISPLTRVQVAPYYGREIPGYEKLGLDRDKIYYGYRPEEELKKTDTINSVNGIPIQLRHHADFADKPAKDTRIGATGTEATYKTPYLMNSLHFFDKKAIDLIESDAMKELSLAYRYRPDFQSSGEINGQKYDFTMRDLSGNHLALVEKGRAGHEVLVYDSDIKPKGGLMDNLALDGMSLDQLKKLVGKVAAAIDKLQAGEKPEKEKEVITETEEEKEVVTDKCGGKKAVAADKCGTKKAAKDTETVEEEETAELETDKKPKKSEVKPSRPEKEEEELAEGEEIVKVEDVRKPAKDKKPEIVKEDETEEESEEVETEEESEDFEESEEDIEETPKKKGNQGMRSDLAALKAAGLDSAPEAVKRAFVAGYKSAAFREKEKFKDEEEKEMATDSSEIEQNIRAEIMAEFKAAQEVKSVLGEIDVGAYDSAEDIYQAACNKLDLRCDKVSAKDVYHNFRKRSKTNIQKAAVTKCSGLGKFLND